MERYLGILLIMFVSFLAGTIFPTNAVLGESTPDNTLPVNQPVTTESSFTEKLEEESESIPKKTVYHDDPEIEAGIEEVLDEGKDGKITRIIKITYIKNGGEYERKVISSETNFPENKKILRGTKIVWRTLDTQDGPVQYWKKMRVYATHYDSHCLGCNEWTAIGIRAGKGVIAVDPKIIPLRSKVYVPGYGVAIAGDTGGSIKGNIIDLGFDDARTSGWKAHFIDIYLL